MDNIEKLKHIISKENIQEIEFIENIGKFIDLSAELNLQTEIEFAIQLLKKHKPKILKKVNKCLFHYFFSVACGDMHRMTITNTKIDWEWKQDLIENELQNLRLSYELINNKIPKQIKSNILTNLANRFNNIGRFINAFDFWNKAIENDKDTGMPLVNKGNALMYYGLNIIQEPKYKYAFIQLAYQYLKSGSNKLIYSIHRNEIEQKIRHIEKLYLDIIDYKFNPLDFTNNEIISNTEYIKWGVNNELFLNPLSNINKNLNSSRDDIKIYVNIQSQFKQLFDNIIEDYKFARFQFYESFNENNKVRSKQLKKSAFSSAYSIFDKIAYTINGIFEVGIKNKNVVFSRIWYNNSDKKKGISSKFNESENLMLRALHWVSKDLYINENGFKNLIEPKAKEINMIRNYIEHKSFDFGTKNQNDFTYQIPETEFNENFIRLLKLVRESILYLAYSIK